MSPWEPGKDRLLRLHRRDCARTFSSFGMVVVDCASCILTPSTERLRNPASIARRGSGRRPTADCPGSSAGSDLSGRGQSSAALPPSAISSANRCGTPSDTSAKPSPALPPRPPRPAVNLRPPCPLLRSPAQIGADPHPIPAQNRLRLYHLDRTSEVGPEPDQTNQNGTVDPAQSQPPWCIPQGNVELVAQEQILGLKSPTGLEQINDEVGESPKDRKHRWL